MIKWLNNKWKVYAIQQFFNNKLSEDEAVDLWDALEKAASTEEVAVIEKDTTRREPYKGILEMEFKFQVINTARDCQRVDDKYKTYLWAWVDEHGNFIETSAIETDLHTVLLCRENKGKRYE